MYIFSKLFSKTRNKTETKFIRKRREYKKHPGTCTYVYFRLYSNIYFGIYAFDYDNSDINDIFTHSWVDEAGGTRRKFEIIFLSTQIKNLKIISQP